MSKRHIGSDFDNFLREEGIFAEVEAAAIKKVVAAMIRQAMVDSRMTKSEMATRMSTSRSQLDRLLDPKNPSVTIGTVAKAAKAVGKKLSIRFEDLPRRKAA